jgi:hypothetical protein
LRPRNIVLAALALGLALAVAACGQQAGLQPALQQSSGQNDPAAAWADQYCGSVVQLVQTLSTMPSVDPSTPRQASRTSSQLLGSIIDGLDRTLSGLTALGPSPVAGGDAMRLDAIGTFSGLRSRAAAAKERLDTSSNDTTATQQALAGASAPLDELSKIDMLQGIGSIPALAAASKRALACEPLTVKGSAVPGSPTR